MVKRLSLLVLSSRVAKESSETQPDCPEATDDQAPYPINNGVTRSSTDQLISPSRTYYMSSLHTYYDANYRHFRVLDLITSALTSKQK